MRSNVGFTILLGLCAILATLGSSCNSPPPGVYADILWRVRCEEMRMCTAYPDRSILGFDRDMGQRISCNVIEREGNRTLSFNASFSSTTTSYSISMTNAIFPRSGGVPAGGGCTLTVTEDNTYTGACGGSPPSDLQPCQVNNVQFTSDTDGRSLITGNIYCIGISPTAAPTIDREITAPGPEPAAATTPLTFSIYDCNGYNPG